eukprot:6176943-Pleurochrysis_carterae.AAC.2
MREARLLAALRFGRRKRTALAAKQAEEFLQQLTVNGQWVWDECAVLRQFLQIPITKQKREAREALLGDISEQKRAQLRDDVLQAAAPTASHASPGAVPTHARTRSLQLPDAEQRRDFGSPTEWSAPARRSDSDEAIERTRSLQEHSADARLNPTRNMRGLFGDAA